MSRRKGRIEGDYERQASRMTDVVKKFIEYSRIDTSSDENSKTSPSTAKQLDLARKLVGELEELGLEDISLDENGYVMASFPSNVDRKVPTVGLIAHMDTSPEISGEGVNARFVENYDGKDIVLDAALNVVLSPSDFPELNKYVGQTLITTDGTTLLGADDKAGIAEIMTAIQHLVDNPEIEHGTIKIAFTPDEEIGRGTDHFDLARFGADVAYTLDGGEIGELEYENFNAAKAVIKITGRNVHPGTAKNQMINSMIVAMELNSLLPVNETPFYTEKYEGFFHLIKMSGDVENTAMQYLIRDHDRNKFEARKKLMEKIVEFLNHKHGKKLVDLELIDQYFNMREKIEPVMFVVDKAEQAIKEAGIEPKIKPIRGGTDGANLSHMGLPTPNLFTGGHNYHGKYEYIPTASMEKAVEVILGIIRLYCE